MHGDATDGHEDPITTHAVLLVQLNDVYQIDTRADYTDEKSLILPRIATLVRRLRAIYGDNRVRFCLPGDFLAPSCLSKEFKGEQMVSVLNEIGVDLVSFGNHEFERDILASDLEARINESRFKWLNLNFEFKDEALQDRLEKSGKMTPVEVLWLCESHCIVLFGILDANTPDHVGHVHYDPKDFIGILTDSWPEEGAEPEVTFVAMTHQKVEKDRELADATPEIALIMGGHDHDVVEQERIKRCLIVKAASNARTIRLNWIVAVPRNPKDGPAPPDSETEPERFRAFAKNVYGAHAGIGLRDALLQTRAPSIEQVNDLSEFVGSGMVDPFTLAGKAQGQNWIFVFSQTVDMTSPAFARMVPSDPIVEQKIREWNTRSHHSETPLAIAPVDLEICDNTVRRYSTNFGNLIADIVRGHPALTGHPFEADIGLINSGSFRIDRDLQAGEAITERTLCDIFYHRNSINRFKVKGSALVAILEQSRQLRDKDKKEGDGEFLQISGLRVAAPKDGPIAVFVVSDFGKEQAIDLEREYSVATTPYVASHAYAAHFGTSSDELHADIAKCVAKSLSELDEVVFPIVVSKEQRWMFEDAEHV